MDHRLGFEPISEELDRVRLPVEGDLPDWLAGTLLRNGPGRFRVGNRTLNHWFDGFSLLRRFAIQDDEIRYSNRFLRSEAYEHAREHGELGFREFATVPDTDLRDRLKRLLSPRITDNACVDIETRGDAVVATTESPRPLAFDPETLETHGQHAREPLGTTTTVHPHYDAHRGETIGYATRFGRNPGYTLYRIPDGRTEPEIVGGVTVDEAAYLHSFALTPNYVVLAENPFVVSPLALLRGSTVAGSFTWKPERGTRFIVFDRASGDVAATHWTEPFFVFHHVNAFERGGRIVLDLVAYPDASVVDALGLDNLRSPSPTLPTGELRRYRLPEDSARDIEHETLHPGHIEFPTIDYARRNTRPYRYVYGVSNRERSPAAFQNQLMKIDVETRTAETWDELNCYPGEPVFVPAPETPGTATSRREDEGVLLSVVLDADAGRSFLLVLDAATVEERARAPVPHAIPFGFHGQFYRDGERPTRSMA
ncbi:carotenoid oxygenase family protein [Halococcus qingdaonensis]|uniref:carotenoid oxygenase family protein n=1 Tax=Halococcus qingdaonensis TaxID=224402 RepID=UPI002116E7D7|nr:carotenoid oxygenase family protein [Halococcus qingdaonensis]